MSEYSTRTRSLSSCSGHLNKCHHGAQSTVHPSHTHLTSHVSIQPHQSRDQSREPPTHIQTKDSECPQKYVVLRSPYVKAFFSGTDEDPLTRRKILDRVHRRPDPSSCLPTGRMTTSPQTLALSAGVSQVYHHQCWLDIESGIPLGRPLTHLGRGGSSWRSGGVFALGPIKSLEEDVLRTFYS